MLKNLNQVIGQVMDLCYEHTETLLIGAAAVIFLIVIIAVIASTLKSEKKSYSSFDDKVFYPELPDSKEKTEDIQAKRVEKEVPCDAEGTKDADTAQKVDNYKQNVIFPDTLLEEIAKVPSGNLKEVEIKIQSAELRFKYGGCGAEDEIFKIKVEDHPTKEDFDTETSEAEKKADEDTKIEDISIKETEPEIEPEEKQTLENRVLMKFGRDNFNVSKSGKIFTEEELEKQIRD